MSTRVFLASDFDRLINAASWRYHNLAIHCTDLTEADRAYAELQQLRADRDAFYAQHHRTP